MHYQIYEMFGGFLLFGALIFLSSREMSDEPKKECKNFVNPKKNASFALVIKKITFHIWESATRLAPFESSRA